MPINILKKNSDLEKAFEEYNPQLFRYVLVRCNMRREIAEELTQDVFIQAWEKRNLFDSKKSSLKNWLYVISRNKVIDFLRKQKFESSFDDLAEIQGTEKTDSSDTDLMLQTILLKMNQLEVNDQEVLLLRYIQGLELDEISKVINKKYSATKVMLHRAMQKLIKLCNE